MFVACLDIVCRTILRDTWGIEPHMCDTRRPKFAQSSMIGVCWCTHTEALSTYSSQMAG